LRLSNNISFIILNWLELLGFVIVYWLIRNIRNELNILREVQVIIISWGVSSMVYFSLNLYKVNDNADTFGKAIFGSILFKNTAAFLGTTIFSIYILIRYPEKGYPILYEGKISACDFDMVFKSQIPFCYFYDYIQANFAESKVYLELFVLT
jgi:hypothetical protein